MVSSVNLGQFLNPFSYEWEMWEKRVSMVEENGTYAFTEP
jgi:hypothetical protein